MLSPGLPNYRRLYKKVALLDFAHEMDDFPLFLPKIILSPLPNPK